MRENNPPKHATNAVEYRKENNRNLKLASNIEKNIKKMRSAEVEEAYIL